MTCEGAEMVRKRKKKEDEQPPWCYYCDRVFSDEQTLVQHQKAKHFKVHIWLPPACQSRMHAMVLFSGQTCIRSWLHMQYACPQALMGAVLCSAPLVTRD